MYRTTIDLAGASPEGVTVTGSWAIDNKGVDIKVNDGHPLVRDSSTSLVNTAGYATLTGFRLDSSNTVFVSGINTIDFYVQNTGTAPGPTGLRVSGLKATTSQLAGAYPPDITVQPLPAGLVPGQSHTIVAAAFGELPLAYQWQLNGVDIPGATTPSLTLNSVTLEDGGIYRLVVTNANGSRTSNPAALAVFDPMGRLFSLFGRVKATRSTPQASDTET